MNFVLFTFFIFASLCSQISTNKEFQSNNGFIQIYTDITKCPMFTPFCLIPFSIRKNVNPNELLLNDGNTRYYNYQRMEFCDNQTTLLEEDCSLEKFNLTHDTAEILRLGYFYIKSKLVAKVNLTIIDLQSNETYIHPIYIVQPNRVLDKVHQVYIIVFQNIISMIMGLLIDVKSLVKIVKMPIPVLVGFFSQYLCMPLLSFACIKLFNLSPVDAFALFIYGCSPGGSQSNNWTILLNGDIDLSAIMTFVSTMSSLVCMPVWLYTLGRVFTDSTNIKVPIERLIINLFTTIGPCLFGLILSLLFPRLKRFILKIAKPFTLLTLFSFLFLTIYTKYYVFTLVEIRQWLFAPIIPWTGFLIGATVAAIFRFPCDQIYTIALETGIQNVGVAFIIVFYNFPSPESDYAILPLISVSFLTTIPLYFLLLFLFIVRKVKKCKKDDAKSIKDFEKENLDFFDLPTNSSETVVKVTGNTNETTKFLQRL